MSAPLVKSSSEQTDDFSKEAEIFAKVILTFMTLLVNSTSKTYFYNRTFSSDRCHLTGKCTVLHP